MFLTAEDEKPTLTLDAALYQRDRMDNDTDWKEYASAKIERTLDCTIGHEEVGTEMLHAVVIIVTFVAIKNRILKL